MDKKRRSSLCGLRFFVFFVVVFYGEGCLRIAVVGFCLGVWKIRNALLVRIFWGDDRCFLLLDVLDVLDFLDASLSRFFSLTTDRVHELCVPTLLCRICRWSTLYPYFRVLELRIRHAVFYFPSGVTVGSFSLKIFALLGITQVNLVSTLAYRKNYSFQS